MQAGAMLDGHLLTGAAKWMYHSSHLNKTHLQHAMQGMWQHHDLNAGACHSQLLGCYHSPVNISCFMFDSSRHRAETMMPLCLPANNECQASMQQSAQRGRAWRAQGGFRSQALCRRL